MTLKIANIRENYNEDHNLNHFVYYNDGTQTVSLKSILQQSYPVEAYPLMKEQHPSIEIRPGEAVLVPHAYYRIYTRDDSPAQLKKVTVNDAVRMFPPGFVKRPQ